MRVYLDIAKKLEKEVRNRLMPGTTCRRNRSLPQGSM